MHVCVLSVIHTIVVTASFNLAVTKHYLVVTKDGAADDKSVTWGAIPPPALAHFFKQSDKLSMPFCSRPCTREAPSVIRPLGASVTPEMIWRHKNSAFDNYKNALILVADTYYMALSWNVWFSCAIASVHRLWDCCGSNTFPAMDCSPRRNNLVMSHTLSCIL